MPSKTERLAADPIGHVDLRGLTASDSSSINYPIRSGETLSQITRDHNYRYATDYTAEEIAALNGISNPDLIYAGDTLKLPVPTTSPYASSGREGNASTSSSVTSSSQQGSGPVLTIGISANFVLGVGGDVSVRLQFDFGKSANSGIVTSAGFGFYTSIEHSSFTSFSDFAETFVDSLSTLNLPY